MSRRSHSRSPTQTNHNRSGYDRTRRQDRYSRDERDEPMRGDSGYNRRRRHDQDRRDDYEKDHDRRDRPSRYSQAGQGNSRPYERRSDRDDRRDRARSRSPPSHPGPSSRRSASPRSLPLSKSKSKSPAPEDEDIEDKAKPNFKPSGLLAAETKQVKHADGTSTVLKYHEPPEARKPTVGWRLYVFKGKEQVDLLHISRQSAYLIGRDRMVVDIPLEHPSCSKQHAAIQFRQVHEKNEFGDSKAVIKPFIIDLESTNSTHVNDEAIPVSRYYELMPGDVIKFGESAREYVILHDEST